MKAFLAVTALVLSVVASADTIKQDQPVKPDTQVTSENGASASIAADYGGFASNRASLADSALVQSEDTITLSFELTSGYTPEPETVQAIATLMNGA
ncbi:MAG TPA: hypothetical protein VHC90_07385 [Bryobacteraceae bacterium]|nr:hypothetical protein [Bryobacteraceae bacterium]